MKTVYDKNGKYVHDWIITQELDSSEYLYVPESERYKLDGGKVLTPTSQVNVVVLRDLCKTINEPFTLEVCNVIAYELDKRGL